MGPLAVAVLPATCQHVFTGQLPRACARANQASLNRLAVSGPDGAGFGTGQVRAEQASQANSTAFEESPVRREAQEGHAAAWQWSTVERSEGKASSEGQTVKQSEGVP